MIMLKIVNSGIPHDFCGIGNAGIHLRDPAGFAGLQNCKEIMGFGAISLKIRYKKRQINYERALGVVGGLKNPLQNALSGRRSGV